MQFFHFRISFLKCSPCLKTPNSHKYFSFKTGLYFGKRQRSRVIWHKQLALKRVIFYWAENVNVNEWISQPFLINKYSMFSEYNEHMFVPSVFAHSVSIPRISYSIKFYLPLKIPIFSLRTSMTFLSFVFTQLLVLLHGSCHFPFYTLVFGFPTQQLDFRHFWK